MPEDASQIEQGSSSREEKFGLSPPSITLPKGGGAINGIGEKFAANPVTGTGSMTVPLFTSPGRSGFGPQLSVSYDSGVGNEPFGFGWSLSAPSITRRTDRGLPKYHDKDESDIFILSGAEDLVPVLVKRENDWKRETFDSPASEPGYVVQRYRPRIEGLFARIERWADKATGISHWRSISRDNITTVYGRHDDARIADPSDATRVFKWLISESYDDKGNAILYRYKPEDDLNIDKRAPCERNRLISGQFAQRYLKAIRYGNRTPRTMNEDLVLRTDWLFEVVFDYGEHDDAVPTTKEIRTWPVRQDPFSLRRSTFDLRTYRLCRRVLMFHHFPDELNGTVDYLVRSTDFEYKETTAASYIASIAQVGYAQQPDGTYFKRALPKLEFRYTEVNVDETVHEIGPESIENLPQGIDGSTYQWIDLDSEGLSGVLTEQAEAWYYKRNLGNGTFGPLEQVAWKPSIAALSGGQQLLDIAGEGHLSAVQYDGPTPGFQERTSDGGWDSFVPFRSLPNINTKDPNVRFVDVTGNGHPDILISEDTVFTWYESLAKDGFASAFSAPKSWDEEKGPKLVFSDSTQSVFLADMAGDGLSDIVRIRCGEVCYWPNLGYGRFGAKVAMGNAPVFDTPDLFDPRRIHLADIDGSGNSDIIYVGGDGVSLYFNQSGNSWSPARRLTSFPHTDSLTSVAPMDLLGNGTVCLVWSSPLASDGRRPMRYIDLMGGQKPHLLVHTTNNMGAETDVQYAASTKFYLQDRLEGHPWVTKLSFPVHVIERVESRDLVSNTKLVTTYRYRHGYFDGVEREFRGFGYVEQRDTESVSGAFDLPPVVTKTWFHNGAFLEENKLEAYFKDPANREFFSGDAEAGFLPDPEVPPDLTSEEMREAARALKGSVLRQEVYSDDGTAKAALPYSVSERSYKLTCLQPRESERHAVFFSHPSETVDYHYERNLADPRISHALTLAVDGYGNVLKSVAVGYQRRVPAFDEQRSCKAILTESEYTNAILEDRSYRTPLPAEIKTFELTAPALAGSKPLDFRTVDTIATAASEIAYEVQAVLAQTQKRLIKQIRTLYRTNDLSALLPAGAAESMALPGESYKLALTPGLLDVFQVKASRTELTSVLTGPEVGYRDIDGNSRLWVPSGRVFFSPGSGDRVPQELIFAQAHFFLPHRYQDPFGNNTVVAYDEQYNLLLVLTRDAVGNRMVNERDYRVLQPRMVTDPNGNRVEVRFDALGMLAGTSLCGKADGPVEGDSFDVFASDLSPARIAEFFDAVDPRSVAICHLGTATTRLIYNLDRIPVCAAVIARETHVSDLALGAQTKAQLHFVYSDGFGREAQTKMLAEPGSLDLADPKSPIANPRWIGTGEKIYNNKGKPIRQYEPFFSVTPQFRIEKWGVSSTLFYDPVQRAVATLHPDHTFEKVTFDPWQQATFDVNDTVTFNPKTDPDAGEYFAPFAEEDYLPTFYQQRIDGAKGLDEKDAAEKAARHANTPTVVHFDILGRAFLTIADNGKDANGADQKYATRTVLDIEGKQREVIDALNRVVMRYDYDMTGSKIHLATSEAGERWMLNDVAGKPIRVWNSRKYAFRTEYDALRRPLRLLVQGGDPAEGNSTFFQQPIVYERTIYGDSTETGLTEAQQKQANLKARIFKHFDSAGIVTTDLWDFKGNSLRSMRQFARDYKNVPDWSRSPGLEVEIFSSTSAHDALNRVVAATAPDKSVYRQTFNEANLLERIDVNLRGVATRTNIVSKIDYNAKGQRTLIQYGNGAETTYQYDERTFRLLRLKTTRPAAQSRLAARIFEDAEIIQDLRYTHDPVGNVTSIKDGALKAVCYANQRVDPAYDYTYDPLYRLIKATGRENIGQSGLPFNPPDGDYRDYPFVGTARQNNLEASRNYTERYDYDPVGNFEKLVHLTGQGSGNWNRTYTYGESSLLELDKKSNRLSGTALKTDAASPVELYRHDVHGNIVQMPHLPLMQWNFKDELSATSRQVVNAGSPETTFYVYDASGQRARKITERQNGTCRNTRLYLGGFELYRDYDSGGAIALERETLHVLDDMQRVALIETQTICNGAAIDTPPSAQLYQLANHLGSASLELDATGRLVSYEEYSPYGCTLYQAGRSAAEVSLKRYRYIGKERDDENGFSYHGARYYAPWLGRWMKCDPGLVTDGPNMYAFVRANPIRLVDPSGCGAAEQQLGASMERGSANHQKAVNARRSQEGLEPVTVDYQEGVGGKREVIPDEVRRSPGNLPDTVVELKARHVDKNTDASRRRSDILENLEQTKNQVDKLTESGEVGPNARGVVLRVLHDNDEGVSSRSQLAEWKNEAEAVYKEWISSAPDPAEAARRAKVRPPVVTTRDQYAKATAEATRNAQRRSSSGGFVEVGTAAELAMGAAGAALLFVDLSENLGNAQTAEEKTKVLEHTTEVVWGGAFLHGLLTGLGAAAVAEGISGAGIGLGVGQVIRKAGAKIESGFKGVVNWSAGIVGFDLKAWAERQINDQNKLGGVQIVKGWR